MNCARCGNHAAAPGGELCRQCEVAAPPLPAHPARPALPPHGAAWLRSPVGFGRAVVALLGVVIAVDLLSMWADTALLDVRGRMADGEWGAAVERDSDWADLLVELAGGLQMLTFFATIAVFLVWFHRVRINAEVFDPSGHGLRRGWAIGGWFVPPVLLWFPRRIAIDCWDASSPREKPRSHVLVNAWWTLWLISLLVREVADRAHYGAESAAEYRSAAKQMLFADAVEIVAAVSAVLFVLALTRMQHDKAWSGPRVPEPVSL
ncbi:DUF4328 domain-containing protein [Streptomyces sp. NPDC057474]|uniref:DUF4328 domain-containing protein n=1 Tax=Streptomyces sp. NPDC057474 TaxID=3346144 RepID=UPI0036C2D3EE